MGAKPWKRKGRKASGKGGPLGNTRTLLGSDVLKAPEPLSVASVERQGGRVLIVRETAAERGVKPLTRSQVGAVVEFVGGWWIAALTLGSVPTSVADYAEMVDLSERRVYESQALFRRAFPDMKSPTELAGALGFDLRAETVDDVPAVVMAMLGLLGK